MTDFDGTARIHDRGYRGFAGARLGPGSSTATLYRHTLYRVLGIQRGARAKILPILTLAFAYLPAIAFIGIAAFLPKKIARSTLPGYADYYGFVTAAIVVFVAFVAPEALCPDRRSRMLGLYLASPLTRARYVIAKIAAVATVVLGVTLGPPLLLAVAYSLEGFGPSFSDLVLLLLRVGAAGLALGAFYTTFSLGASSLTDRRGFASTGIILSIILSGAATGIFYRLGAPQEIRLLNLSYVPFETVQRIYGAPSVGQQPDTVATWAVFAAFAVWTVAGTTAVWWRYHRIEVSR